MYISPPPKKNAHRQIPSLVEFSKGKFTLVSCSRIRAELPLTTDQTSLSLQVMTSVAGNRECTSGGEGKSMLTIETWKSQ